MIRSHSEPSAPDRASQPGQASRRQFLRRAGGAAGVAALGSGSVAAWLLTEGSRVIRSPVAAAPADPAQSFRSLPRLHPAAVSMAGGWQAGEGYLFIAPGTEGPIQAGPLITDSTGEPVWFRPNPKSWVTNFRSWSYLGEPRLAWWEGYVVMPFGYGHGEAVIADRFYREQIRLRPVGGGPMDMHEFRITPEGTALYLCYPRVVAADLSGVGGPRDGKVLESVFQEVDLRTGRLLTEWRSLDHIGVEESYKPLAEPYDYLHLNSISVAPDGNLLVSGRHTWTVYKLDRRTGEVIWRLGGRRGDFDLPLDAEFAWQHDAQQPMPGVLTVFDNGYEGHIQTHAQSRGLVLGIDESARSTSIRHALYHPDALLSTAMGSVQILPDGHLLVGWGSQPYMTEYTPDGAVLADARLGAGQQCYRSFRFPWAGEPDNRPALRANRHFDRGTSTLYASWNGATGLAGWQVLAGPHRSSLRPIGIIPRRGFETPIALNGDSGHVAVTAIDEHGRLLRSSRVIRL